MRRTCLALCRALLFALTTMIAFGTAAPAAAQNCAPATTQGTAPSGWQTYCWLNVSTYNDAAAQSAGGQNFSYALSDGSVLSLNLRVTPGGGTAFNAIAAPSWTGAALGNTAFLGIPGQPVPYSTTGGTRRITISNILITPPAGVSAVSSYSFVIADAESSNNGESLRFTTNGGGWAILDDVPPTRCPPMSPMTRPPGSASPTARQRAGSTRSIRRPWSPVQIRSAAARPSPPPPRLALTRMSAGCASPRRAPWRQQPRQLSPASPSASAPA